MKNKKLIILIISIILIFLIIFFIKNNYISSKKGNNISNKSADEIKEYILSIETYEATVEVTVKSNKNENTYELKQKYDKENNTYRQEVVKPEHIAGVEFVYEGANLKIENTKLNLNKLYEDYKYIESNELSLISFIEDFKASKTSKFYEKGNMVLLETEVKNGNKYVSNKKLYINKKEGKIEKIEIKDSTQNTKIYILYNEIEIN